MAANSGASRTTAKGESTRPTLDRHFTRERVDAEREQIQDLATEVCQWLSQTLNVEITSENYTDKLDTGVELCRLQNILVEGGEEAKIKYHANAKKKSMYAQENITRFIEWCKGFIHSDDVLESNDLVDHKREHKCQMRVLSCLEKVKKKYSSKSEIIEEVPETQMPDIPNLTSELESSGKEEKPEVASSIQEPASDNDGDESRPTSTKPVSIKGPQEEEELEEKEVNAINNSVPEPNAESAFNNESQPPSTEPIISNEGPKDEESEDEKEEGKITDSSNSAPEPTVETASNDDAEYPSAVKPTLSNEGSQKEKNEEENQRKNIHGSTPEPTDVHASINNSKVRSRPSARNEQSPGESSQNKVRETSGDHNPSRNGSDTACSYFYPLLFLCLISIILLGGLYFLMK